MKLPRFLWIAGLLIVPPFSFVGYRGAASAADDEYAVQALAEEPPADLAEPVRAVLESSGYRVQDAAGKVVCEVWLRKELAVNPAFKPSINVKYGFPRSHLVGAIRFPGKGAADLRAQKLRPGVYTLRYVQQPVDGNHVGTWPYQDFVALCASKKDVTAEDREEKEAIDLSMASRAHPVILSLMPPAEREKLPAMAHQSDMDLWILAVPAKAKAGGEARNIHIELVVLGKAEV